LIKYQSGLARHYAARGYAPPSQAPAPKTASAVLSNGVLTVRGQKECDTGNNREHIKARGKFSSKQSVNEH